MALMYPLIVTSTTLLCCCLQLISADLSPSPQLPPVYVIQNDEPDRFGVGSPSEIASRHWNNQKLVPRQPASSQARSAKQLIYTDEPVPYYHSYKYMGFGVQAASGRSALGNKQLYEPPLGGSGDHLKDADDSWSAAREGLLYRGSFVDRGGERAGTKGRSGKTSSRAGSSSKVGRGKTSPANRRHHSPPVLADSDNTGLAFPSANGTTRRRAGGSFGKKKNLVCYYGTWAVYRPDAGKFPVENIDPFLCTHIIYGFTGLSYDNLIKPLDPWNDLEDNYGKGAMKRFTNLKRINPDLKTLVAIGGWNEGSIKYSKMASEPESRAKFVASVVDFLAKYNFDGLDLDWEYPSARGGYSYDKQNFVKLLRELKEAFRPQNYLLTAAVSAGKWFIDPAYDIAQVSKYLDLINLMAYDYHGGWESKTGMNAPLFHSPKYDLTKDEAQLNVNWSVNYWLQQGAPAEKIMLGVGSYGRSFTLDRNQVNGINAPASQKGQAGPYTREPGSLGYNEICEMFKRSPQSWTIVRDPDYLAPYAYNNERQWVGYDDVQSLALKAQFAKSMGLGGMMMWSIETDDFLGRCHGEKYPLLNTLKRGMIGESVLPPPPPPPPRPNPAGSGGSSTRRPSTTTTTTTYKPTTGEGEKEDEPVSSTTTTKPATSTRRPTTRRPGAGGSTSTTSRRPVKPSTTTTRPDPTGNNNNNNNNNNGAEFVCSSDGMFADPNNCRKFIRCVSSGNQARYLTYKFDCGPGTAFNQQQQYCDFIYNVPSCNNNNLNSNPNLNRSLKPRINQTRTNLLLNGQSNSNSISYSPFATYSNLMLQHQYNQIHSTLVG